MSDIINKLKEEQAIDNFKKWFGDSKVTYSDGEPLVLYTGTFSDFSVFDLARTTNDSYIGKGFYISDSYEDVNNNYANTQGPDYLIKISHLKENIEDDISTYLENDYYESIIENNNKEEVGEELYDVIFNLFENKNNPDDLLDIDGVDLFVQYEMNRILRKEHEGFVLPVYLKIENPMYIDTHIFEQEEKLSGKKFDLIKAKIEEKHGHDLGLITEICGLMPDINIEYSLSFEEFEEAFNNSVGSYLDEEESEELFDFAKEIFDDSEITVEYSHSGELLDFQKHFKEILEDYGYYDMSEKFTSLFSSLLDNSYDYQNVNDILTNQELNEEFCDLIILENGIFNNETTHFKGICSMVFQKMGYDGIVMQAANYFKNMENVDGVLHYIVFDPNQIKSSIGNNGEYSLQDPDIRYRINYRIKKDYKLQNTVSNNECKKILNNIKKYYPKAPEIVVISDKNYLDKKLIEKHPQILDSSGYYLGESNKVLIILQNIENVKDFVQTISHEIFGHMSLKQVLNSDYEKTMDKIYSYYDSKGQLEDEKRIYTDIYKLDLTKASDRAKIAEEKMATVIEKNGFDKFPLKNVIIGAIKKSIRKYIPNLPFTENDIIYIAQRTHDNLKPDKKKKKKLKNHF